MKLVTSLMNFECHPCGIFNGFSYHQEDEAIDPTIFAANVGVARHNKEVILLKLHGHGETSFIYL